jgi:hypothetical protein
MAGMDWYLIGCVLDSMSGFAASEKQSPLQRTRGMMITCIGLGLMGVIIGAFTARESWRILGIVQITVGAGLILGGILLIKRWRRLRRTPVEESKPETR